ncbi:MAG TPA: type II secretion system protein [Candidatus Saccharimonadales bacterium]|jgi:prepilin-type N-terminal cleavage/methylation domain-containing protein|nr:type II secretion system protein [Candidatus Saccharimonadales bacterium]
MKNLKSKILNLKSGFTLIELLVVISIIGILSALALSSFSTAQKQARDAQRKSDLKQYQNSLESYANKNGGLYISWTTGSGASSTVLCTGLGLTGCPEDSKNTSDPTYAYKYQSDGTNLGTVTATKYVLWDKLESVTNYWVLCSNGKTGNIAQGSWSNPVSGACPLP